VRLKCFAEYRTHFADNTGTAQRSKESALSNGNKSLPVRLQSRSSGPTSHVLWRFLGILLNTSARQFVTEHCHHNCRPGMDITVCQGSVRNIVSLGRESYTDLHNVSTSRHSLMSIDTHHFVSNYLRLAFCVWAQNHPFFRNKLSSSHVEAHQSAAYV
jgi:hypothetical protein